MSGVERRHSRGLKRLNWVTRSRRSLEIGLAWNESVVMTEELRR